MARCSENVCSVQEPASGSTGPRACARVVLLAVVGDVLADSLLASASEVDYGRLAEKVGTGLELEAFERVLLDLEREVADGVVQAHRAAYATAVSAARRAFATISARLISRVRPPECSCRYERTNGVTLCPETFAAAAADTADSIRSSTSRLSGGGCASKRPPPPSSQCARAMRAASRGVLDPLRHGRASFGGVEERQCARAEPENGYSERLQELDRRGHVQE